MEVCLLATTEIVTKISSIQCKYKKLNMRVGVIYKITSPKNRVYIGQTVNLSYRFLQHRLSKGGYMQISRSIAKYGWKNHTRQILYVSKPNSPEIVLRELNEKEIQFIAAYDSFRRGMNLTKGGDGTLGHIPTESTRRKLSKIKKEYFRTHNVRLSDEHKRKIGFAHRSENLTYEQKYRMKESAKRGWLARKANPGYVPPGTGERKPVSDEARRKMSLSALGKSKSEETKQRMREAWVKRLNDPNYVAPTFSAETRLKMSVVRVGTKRSEETKARMKLAQKLSWEKRVRTQSEEARRNNGEAQKRAWARRKLTVQQQAIS